MPRTISEGFDDFHNKLKLVNSESESVKSHRASIEACLMSNFGMNRFFKTGSIGNGTNVNGYSDTDYFAGIPREKLKRNSIATLREIKDVLQSRFPRTNIYVSSPAVVVDFGRVKSETTEVIPADYLKNENGVNIYDIPDGNGSWMNSSPKSHNDYVTRINSSLGYKVKSLIRFMKAWKFYNNVPISSFYLEMKTAKYASERNSIMYSHDIRAVLRHLLDNELASMRNPSGIPGIIVSCKSDADKEEALSKIRTALGRVNNAINAEIEIETKDAFYWWNLIFNKNFPSYYY